MLSQLACSRIRLARAFAAKVRRPDGALPVELDAALQTAAAGAREGRGRGAERGDRVRERRRVPGGRRGFQGGREGGLELSSGCGVGVRVEGGVFSMRGAEGIGARTRRSRRRELWRRFSGEGEGEDEGVGVGEGVSFPAQGTRERRCVADFAWIDRINTYGTLRLTQSSRSSTSAIPACSGTTFAAIIAAVGLGSKNTGTHSCGAA